ncbi:nitroreductase family protein [Konateibacter massiliensis]|uniref:nitroreductase family protein n=1 Tax=Konateibacter massiliensis TaxID=2002841 RepID=UPI000C16029E|nr:nitroreductase family protein [Konateibacter massiliensis]
MEDFLTIVRERRSANKFLKGIKVPREDFDSIFEDLTQAPTCFNLQHAHYYIGETEETINELYKASYNQYKVLTSSATIIVTGDKDAYKNAAQIYEASKFLKIIDEEEYEAMLKAINGLYEGGGAAFQHDEAIRNASITAMLFMLLAKNRGWDTCPMIYFDSEKVKEIFEIPENEVPVLMLTMGKMDPMSFRVRGYRKPQEEYVKYK